MFLSLLQDGLPACSTSRQVSGEPWTLEPKVEGYTLPPFTLGGAATNSSIILTLLCFLFNSISP